MAMVVGLLLLFLLLLLTHRDWPCGGCCCRRCVLFLTDRRSKGGNYLDRTLEFRSDADTESDTGKTKIIFAREPETHKRSDKVTPTYRRVSFICVVYMNLYSYTNTFHHMNPTGCSLVGASTCVFVLVSLL